MTGKRAEREIPDAWREAVAARLEAWIAKQPLTKAGKPLSERALAPMLGISSFSLNRLRLKKGPMGIHVLVALTIPLELTLDELLGIPVTPAAIRRALHEVLAEHEAARAAEPMGRGRASRP